MEPTKPIEIAFPLPNAPRTKVHLSVTKHLHAIIIFVSTGGEASTRLGSFVYAIPNVSLISRYSLSQY
jgi:hypothetical protein